MEERFCGCTECFSFYAQMSLFYITAFGSALPMLIIFKMLSECSLSVTFTIISYLVSTFLLTRTRLQFYPCFVVCHILLLYAILYIYISQSMHKSYMYTINPLQLQMFTNISVFVWLLRFWVQSRNKLCHCTATHF